jgi:hypothetical protein
MNKVRHVHISYNEHTAFCTMFLRNHGPDFLASPNLRSLPARTFGIENTGMSFPALLRRTFVAADLEYYVQIMRNFFWAQQSHHGKKM